MRSTDVLVIGAGPAGLFAAWRLLQESLSVRILEAHSRKSWGQRWCVDVEERYFEEGYLPTLTAGVELEEGRAPGLLARPPEGGRRRWSPDRFPIRTLRLWRLQADLVQRIEALGGEVVFGRKVTRLDRDGRGDAVAHTSDGSVYSGKGLVIAAGTRPVDDPALARVFDLVGDLTPWECVHGHHEIREIDGHGYATAPGEFAKVGTVLRFGLGGPRGFSMEKLACHPDEGLLLCLAATFPQDGQRGPREVLAEVPGRVAFAGPVIMSRGQPIPLRRALPALAGHGVVLAGDAGSQVMPLSGSGTGFSAMAATLLAPAMVRYLRSRDVRDLWEYSRAWHAEVGAEQLRQDLITRFARTLPASKIQQFADLGLLQIDDFRRVQAEGRVIPEKLLTRAQLSRVPALPRVMGLAPLATPMLAAVLATNLVYQSYPKDPSGIRRWSAKVGRLLRSTPVKATTTFAAQ